MRIHLNQLLTPLLVLPAPALAGDVILTLDAGDGFVIEDNTATVERLRVDEATGDVYRNGELLIHTIGTNNLFIGKDVGSTTNPGFSSTAVGENALSANTSGYQNSAFGYLALSANTLGRKNTALGGGALGPNTWGSDNTAAGGIAVLINTDNELHTLVSSQRFKRNVRDMAGASDVLTRLRPVVFQYRDQESDDTPQYGLIAEEVAAIAPELVTYDPEGQPYSVRYQVLAPMLLNELQRQQRVIELLERKVDQLLETGSTGLYRNGT